MSAPFSAWPCLVSTNVPAILLIALPGIARASEGASALQLAYLDPATGSLVIQALLGTLAAAVVTTRLYWKKIKGWLGMTSPEQPDDGDLTSRTEIPPRDG